MVIFLGNGAFMALFYPPGWDEFWSWEANSRAQGLRVTAARTICDFWLEFHHQQCGYTQSGKSVHRLFENKSQWDAAHSGSHRSQCKIMQISMGRCAPAIIYCVKCSVFFMALELGIILWTLHLCSHCFRLFWNDVVEKRNGTQVSPQLQSK